MDPQKLAYRKLARREVWRSEVGRILRFRSKATGMSPWLGSNTPTLAFVGSQSRSRALTS